MALWDKVKKALGANAEPEQQGSRSAPSIWEAPRPEAASAPPVPEAPRQEPPATFYDPRHDDGPVPALHAEANQRRYERHSGGSGAVTGFTWKTADGHIMKDWCCGATQWDRLGIYQVDVVGESFRTATELEAVVPGEPALLVPEPDNPHDANAIAVRTTTGEHVGYAKGSTTKTVRRLAGKGPFHAMFWALHRDETGKPCAVEVMMFRPGAAKVPADLPVHEPLAR
jgi:hypothetical protein